MLIAHYPADAGRLACALKPFADGSVGDIVWLDLLNPTQEEENAVERAMKIDVPTKAERGALEASSRFYATPHELYLTATVISTAGDAPVTGAVTFILKDEVLVTVRELEPRAFRVGDGRASARLAPDADGRSILAALLEGVVERLADLLDEVARDADAVSESVFDEDAREHDLSPTVRRLGRLGALAAKVQESLTSLSRLASYALAGAADHGLDAQRFRAVERDVGELERYADSLDERLIFVLDAALGLVSASQNQAVRAMSVVAVLFLPPTLIASLYGMNFKFMPELHTIWGYPLSVLLMVLSSALLYIISKRNNWL